MIKFSEKNQQYAVCPAGVYGHDGEATIAVCRATDEHGAPLVKPWDKDNAAAKPAIELVIKVNHPEMGVQRVSKWMDAPTGPEDMVGGTVRTFAALGVTDEQFAAGFEPESLVGLNVVVDVTNTTNKDGRLFANLKSVQRL